VDEEVCKVGGKCKNLLEECSVQVNFLAAICLQVEKQDEVEIEELEEVGVDLIHILI
jgi:hypothetical protein